MSNITEIREKLRDVGDVNLSSNLRVRPTLRKYKHSFLGKKYVELEFKFYIGFGLCTNTLPPRGWKPVCPGWGYEKIDLSRIEFVEQVSVEESGLVVKCSTIDPIHCKEVAEKIIQVMLKKVK